MADTKNIKVLLVEDNKDICEMYAATFMREGFTVYTAGDGKSAVEKFHNKKPDIVLLDIMLPEADGFSVLKTVRKQMNPYTPVVMLTNLDANHFEKHANFDEVDAYLVKSNYTPSEIVLKTIEILKVNKML